MPAVARRNDVTRCPAHAKGHIAGGLGEVLICFKPVARVGDEVRCNDGSIDAIVEGSATVWIGGKPVAYKGSKTAHGGVIVTGCPRVSVGSGLRNLCKLRAARERAAFIKYLVRKKVVPFIAPTAE